MIRSLLSARTTASIFMPRRKRRSMMPSMSAMGILAGAGIAYMAMRKNKTNNNDDND